MARRLTRLGVLAAGVLLVALFLLPWWLGGALRVASRWTGADFDAYRKLGYTRWELQGVMWIGPTATVRIDRVEAGHPLGWLAGWGREQGINVSGWSVELQPSEKPADTKPGGWGRTFDILARTRDALVKWVPRAHATDGEIRRGDEIVRIAEATWNRGRLDVRGIRRGEQEVQAELDWLDREQHPRLSAREARSGWGVNAEINGNVWSGRLSWQQQHATFATEFGESGWSPTSARLQAESWTVPGSWLGFGAYYPAVDVTVSGEWMQDAGRVVIAARGEPAEDASVPPLQVDLRAEGGTERVTVSELRIQAPGMDAVLDRPMVIDPDDPLTGLVATLQVKAHVDELTAKRWRGNVDAQVQVEPVASGFPRVHATATIDGFAGDGWEPVDARAEALLEWPQLELVHLALSDAAGSTIEASGRADLNTRTIDRAVFEGRMVRATSERWLPDELAFEDLSWRASARGPIDALQHEGEARSAEFTINPVRPASVNLAWRGRMLEIDVEAEAEVSEGNARLEARVTPRAALVRSLLVADTRGERFRSVQPAEVSWTPRLVVKGLKLGGPDLDLAAEIDVVGQGRVGIDAPHLDLAWLDAWLQEPLPVREAEELRLRGVMEDGSLVFETAGRVRIRLAQDEVAQLDVSASGTREELVVRQLDVHARNERVLSLAGRLPVVLQPGAQPWFRIDRDRAMTINGSLGHQTQFWEMVARSTGVRMEQPDVEIAVEGTWNEPRGSVRAEAARLAVDPERWPGEWPVVTALRLNAEADGTSASIQEFSFRVEDQPVSLEAKLPVSREAWTHLRSDPLGYLREHGTGRLVVPEVELSAFARLVPEYLAPAGRAEAEIAWTRDGLDGYFRLHGAVTRPLGPLGILQDVSADLRFSGRELRIQKVGARMGGQPVQLTGQARLESDGPVAELKLTGRNLPIIRQTGILLRGDLDLGLKTDASGAGQVTGLVRLTDGLFLADLQDVVPRGTGVRRPTARPPYFSVAVEPLRDWRIDVRVEGSEFLRLRTPVLESTASAEFQLSGTLMEPRAIGEATLEGGIVRLPFAVFSVEEGEVRLTQADPFEPRLSLIGSSRRMGYDLRMELTGTAGEPRLQFSSSPPLSSEEILLLVMAGQAPQEEVAYTGRQRAMQIGTFLGRGVIGDIFGGSGEARLTFTTGERVSRQGRETYRFAYELTPRLSLVGEYDEFDSYNAGLRWQVLPRRNDQPAREAPAVEEDGGGDTNEPNAAERPNGAENGTE